MSVARRISVFAKPVLLSALLASCSQGGLQFGASGSTDSTPEPVEVRDAAVFQKTENALWDGRPSLGGVWIAHPDATTPERVEIRNEDTGNVIQAALFRRERDFPGPSFQLSSDAAVALRINAGTPTSVTVTALRREPVAAPPPLEAAAEVEPATAVEPAEDPELPAVDAAINETLAAEDSVSAEIALTAEPDGPAAGGSAGSMLFGAKPRNTGVNAPGDEPAIASEVLTSGAEADQTAPDAVEPETGAPAADPFAEPVSRPRAGSAGSMPGNRPTLVDDSGAPIAVAGSSLEPITATEILAVPLPEPAAEVPATTPEAPTIVETGPEVLPEAGTAASDLERPYVQVASGSTKANVDELAARLVAAGLAAVVRETTQDGKALFYVVVGPFRSQAELDAGLAQVRGMGYPEAFIAKG